MHILRLTRGGNSTGLTLPNEVLAGAGLNRGDQVVVRAVDGRIVVSRAEANTGEAIEAGRRFAARYRRTMAALGK